MIKIATPGNLRATTRELCSQSLYRFAKRCWPVVEPGEAYRDGWHIQAICDHLQAVSEGHIQRLLINIPPGHAKSLLVSVIWPAWQWINRPKWRSIFASYGQDLATRDSLRCRRLIESAWYSDLFCRDDQGEVIWTLASDANQKTQFQNTKSGERLSTSPEGRGVGYRGNAVVVDDPINVKKAMIDAERQKVSTWFFKTMQTRVNNRERDSFVVVMQRLHAGDLSAEILERGGYEHLCLPSEYDPERVSVTYNQKTGSEFWRDPRKESGDLLFPAMFSRPVLRDLKEDLGVADYEGQHNQNPSSLAGSIFKRKWLTYWRYSWEPAEPPALVKEFLAADVETGHTPRVHVLGQEDKSFRSLTLSIDGTFKGEGDAKDPDYVVGSIWALGTKEYKSRRVLVDQFRAKLGFVDTVATIKRYLAKYPKIRKILIEDKANGSAIVDTLRREVSGVIPINPQGGKIARAFSAQVFFEAGDVVLPLHMEGLHTYITELLQFPNGKHDDQVDSTTQALIHLEGDSSAEDRLRALAKK